MSAKPEDARMVAAANRTGRPFVRDAGVRPHRGREPRRPQARELHPPHKLGDGVTVAYDYDAALAELDRGVEGLRTLARSNDDQLVGVAMSPAVPRDGKVKVHLVFSGAYIESIDATPEQDDAEVQSGMQQAIHLIAHECAHVQVTTEKDEAFPGTILRKQVSSYEEQLRTAQPMATSVC